MEKNRIVWFQQQQNHFLNYSSCGITTNILYDACPAVYSMVEIMNYSEPGIILLSTMCCYDGLSFRNSNVMQPRKLAVSGLFQ